MDASLIDEMAHIALDSKEQVDLIVIEEMIHALSPEQLRTCLSTPLAVYAKFGQEAGPHILDFSRTNLGHSSPSKSPVTRPMGCEF